MSAEITTINHGAVMAPANDWMNKLDLVKSMVAKGCTNDEFGLLCHLARVHELDPLARQIWAVKYGNNPAQIFVGRDGLLAIAHRSGTFDGMETGTRYDTINGKDELVAWCRVYRKDMTHPFYNEVCFSEYGADARNPLWRSKPRTMLIKVAEAHALRHAYPIAGLYLREEIDVDEQPRVIPDTSRRTSTIADVPHQAIPAAQPAPATGTEGNPVTCGRCGQTVDQNPSMRIAKFESGYRCYDCIQKDRAEAQPAHAPAPAPAPAVIDAEIVEKPAPAGICTECGMDIETSEKKTSMLMYQRPLCRACIQKQPAADTGREW